MALLLLSLVIPLTGCGTIIKYEPLIYTVEVPEALRTCASLPPRPSGTYTQREVSLFIVRLDNARKDCKIKLEELVKLIDVQNQNALELKNERTKK